MTKEKKNKDQAAATNTQSKKTTFNSLPNKQILCMF